MLGTRWLDVDGLRTHAKVDAAPGEKPPLVLVHGLGVSSRYLLPAGERLLDDFAVYAPDLPGYGRSEKPPKPLDVQGLARALGEWLDAAGIPPPTALANSLGCQIATELAVQRPERLARLVLVGPTVDRYSRTTIRQTLGLARDALVEPLALNVIVARDYLRAGLLRVWKTGQFALDDRIEDRIGRIDVPILIVHGERDGFVSERWVRELAARSPSARLVEVPGAGHAVNFNSPETLAQLVREFAL